MDTRAETREDAEKKVQEYYDMNGYASCQYEWFDAVELSEDQEYEGE